MTISRFTSQMVRNYSTQSGPLYMSYIPVHKGILNNNSGKNKFKGQQQQHQGQQHQQGHQGQQHQQVGQSNNATVQNDMPTHQIRSAASTYLVVDDA